MVQIQKHEWRWVCFYALGLTVLLTLPYLIGFTSQTPANRFSGALVGTEDLNSYFAKMNQGAHGEWLFTIPYTSERQQGSLLYLFYLLLGKISGEGYLARVIIFHLTRIIFGFALVLVIYRFQAEFLAHNGLRRLALVMTTVGGGLGWLLILAGRADWFGYLPLEFSSPEAYSFLMLITLPHLLAARCLLLAALLAFLYRRHAWAGLALLPIGLLQPATVVIGWVVIVVFVLIKLVSEKDFSAAVLWAHIRSVMVVVGLSCAPIVYLGYLFLFDPVLKQWSAQNIIPSPHPLHYASAYGIYLLLAIFGMKSLKQTHPDLWRLAIGWMLIVPILLYLPLGIQRRLIEGFQIPLVALSVLGLAAVLHPRQKWLITVTLVLILPSSVLLWEGIIQSAQHITEPVFRPADELSAFDWLDQHAQPGQVVLSSFPTGNALPAYAPLVAFVGHSSETVFLNQKMQQAASFYNNDTDNAERRRILSTGRIDYVFYGPHEQDAELLDLSSLPYLIKRFQQGNYAVYEVVTP